MAFDPDAYLKRKQIQSQPQGMMGPPEPEMGPQQTSFDPDKYLLEKAEIGPVTAGIRSAANTVSFGTYPHLVAGVEELGELIGLGDDKDYDERVQKYKTLIKKGEEQNPISSTIGNIGGLLTGTSALAKGLGKVPGLGKLFQIGEGAGKVEKIAKAGGAGAVTGFLETPETGLTDLEARAKQAGTGLLFGGAAQGGLEVLKKGSNTITNLIKGAKNSRDALAFKQAGAMLKDFRAANKQGKLNEIGDFLIDSTVEINGKQVPLMKLGDTFDDIAEKVAMIKTKAGDVIGETYDEAAKFLDDAAIFKKLSPKAQNDILNRLPTSETMTQELMESIQKIKPTIGKDAYEKKMSEFIFDIAGKPSNEILDIKYLKKTRGEIDKLVRWAKENKELPSVQKGLKELRRVLRKKEDDLVELLEKYSPNKTALKKLKEANKMYNNSTTVLDVAADRMSREQANRIFGLTDTMAGLGGIGYGLSQEGLSPEALTYGLLGAGANRAGRRYGPGLLSKSLGLIGSPKNIQRAEKANQIIQKIKPTQAGAIGGRVGNQ